MIKTILIETKPNSSQNKIEKITDLVYKVWLTASPVNGKANKAMIKLMAKYFKVGKSQIKIKSGKKSRNKVLIIS